MTDTMNQTCGAGHFGGTLTRWGADACANLRAEVRKKGEVMRVLVVEDERDLLAVVAQSLREDGYAVDTAEDGREGFLKAKAGLYDAVVLDLMLPKMDGWTVLKELRKAGVPVPVLVLTARDALSDRVKGLDSGADDYLSKPFELAELLARLRALIRRSAGKPSSVVDVGDIRIDTASKTITKGGEAVALTAREYALVEFLAIHRGELVSRSMIYDHLFDDDDDSLSNLVDVHVSNVRKKLGKDFITTRRGQGYLLGGQGAGGEEDEGSGDDV
jgi:DNA-binding response OmpR family regulator